MNDPAPADAIATLWVAGNLAPTAFASQLHAGFVELQVPVQAAGRELAATGVHGELTVERDAPAALHECSSPAAVTETERLQPEQREDAPPVVHLRDVDVVRGEPSPRPEVLGGRVHAEPAPDRLDGQGHPDPMPDR